MHLLSSLILLVGMFVAAAACTSVTACAAGLFQSLPNIADGNYHRNCRDCQYNQINSRHRLRLSFFLQSRTREHLPPTGHCSSGYSVLLLVGSNSQS